MMSRSVSCLTPACSDFCPTHCCAALSHDPSFFRKGSLLLPFLFSILRDNDITFTYSVFFGADIDYNQAVRQTPLR